MYKNKKQKSIPKFKNDDEERKFWAKNDFSDYVDQYEPVKLKLSKLKPSKRSITVRMPESLLAQLKKLAHKRDVPYQSLLKIFLADRVKKEITT
jgi:predicted DNA binding CopG/RHH family protein